MNPNLSSTALTAVTPDKKDVVGLVHTLFGPAGKEFGEMVADRVRFWRWKSAVKVLKRANEIRKEEQINHREISLKFFLPFIEEASKESEDSELHDWWARLLSSASEESQAFDFLCLDILKKLGSGDAKFLHGINRTDGLVILSEDGHKLSKPIESIQDEVQDAGDTIDQNLFSLAHYSLDTVIDDENILDDRIKANNTIDLIKLKCSKCLLDFAIKTYEKDNYILIDQIIIKLRSGYWTLDTKRIYSTEIKQKIISLKKQGLLETGRIVDLYKAKSELHHIQGILADVLCTSELSRALIRRCTKA